MKVALKYCGSCNPRIELGPIGRRLREITGNAVAFVSPADGKADLVVILNACPTACADRPDVRDQATDVVVVAGEYVQLQAVPERHIAERVVELLLVKAKPQEV